MRVRWNRFKEKVKRFGDKVADSGWFVFIGSFFGD